LLEACRGLGNQPTVVFSSSVAVFGKLPGAAMPDPIDDFTLPTPQSSYGAQRAPDDGERAPGPAQRRGVELLLRDDPRAAGRRARAGSRGARNRSPDP